MEHGRRWSPTELCSVFMRRAFLANIFPLPIGLRRTLLRLRIRPDGTKEILGLWIEQTEGAKFWLRVMNELKNRGVEDVLIAVVDGLKGFPEAITAVFPQTQVQTCIVHLIRNSLDFVSYKDRKAVAAALKQIYRAGRRRRRGRTERLRRRPMGPKIPGNRPVLATPLERGHPILRLSRRSASDHLYDKRNRVIERQIAESGSRPRPFPHRRERAEASFSRVEPGPKRMENAAARVGHGESAIRDHFRGQVQVGVTKPAFTRKS